MPKTRKKEKKKDFSKNKLKLGRPRGLKKKSVTAVNLSFKTRVINIVEQLQEKGDEVTHKKLDLVDLFSKLRHHNDNIRKDALLGIKELITHFNNILKQHLGEICEKIVEKIVDPAVIVRNALHTLLKSMFTMIDESTISPFLPLFYAYISSAMTHAVRSIRLDVIRFIDLWINHYPHLITQKHASIYPLYLSLLSTAPITQHQNSLQVDSTAGGGAGGGGVGGGGGGHKVNITILSSLYKFTNAFLQPTNKHSFKKLIQAEEYIWDKDSKNTILLVNNSTVGGGGPYLIGDAFPLLKSNYEISTASTPALTAVVGVSSITTPKSLLLNITVPDQLVKFLKEIIPNLCGIWLESDPTHPDLENIESMLLILLLMHYFLGLADKQGRLMYLPDFMKYFFVHFPYEGKDTWTGEDRGKVTSINVIFCKVISLFLFERTKVMRKQLDHISFEDDIWEREEGFEYDHGDKLKKVDQSSLVNALLSYILSALEGKLSQDTSQWKIRSSSSRYCSLIELLPLLPKLLPYLTYSQQTTLLEAFNAFYQQCPPKSATKNHCILFMKELLLANNCSKKLEQTITDMAHQWLPTYPKLLWQLGTSAVDVSLLILQILLSYGSKKNSARSPIFNSLQNLLVPFFYAVPKKASANGITTTTTTTGVYGPFIHLPVEVQKVAVEVLFYFENMNESLLKSVTTCLIAPEVHSSLLKQVLSLIKYPTHVNSLATYISMIWSIVVGCAKPPSHLTSNTSSSITLQDTRKRALNSKNESENPSSRSTVDLLKKPDEVAEYASQAAHALKLKGKLIQILEPQLLDFLNSEGLSRSAFLTVLRFLACYISYQKKEKEEKEKDSVVVVLRSESTKLSLLLPRLIFQYIPLDGPPPFIAPQIEQFLCVESDQLNMFLLQFQQLIAGGSSSSSSSLSSSSSCCDGLPPLPLLDCQKILFLEILKLFFENGERKDKFSEILQQIGRLLIEKSVGDGAFAAKLMIDLNMH